MPKAVKKKVSKTKRPVSKKKPVKKAAVKVANEKPSFMWRLLKQKEAERQKQALEHNQHGGFGPKVQGPVSAKQQGFSRFAGPRRRAA